MAVAIDEASYRRIVASVWVLLRTAGSGGSREAIEAAARDCESAAGEVLEHELHFVLQERDGALFGNGRRIRPDVASFASTTGITALMQDHSITELMFTQMARIDDYVELARCWTECEDTADFEAALQARGSAGIHVSQDRSAVPHPLPGLGAQRAAPSQLGAVFTLQQLTTALEPMGPLAGSRARAVLQKVLHQLLRSGHGLEPLVRIQRDPDVYNEAVRACVLAVRTAEELAWDEARGDAAGRAALLGAGAGSAGDAEVAELARAAQAVAALMGTQESAAKSVEQLVLLGQLSGELADAMNHALLAPA